MIIFHAECYGHRQRTHGLCGEPLASLLRIATGAYGSVQVNCPSCLERLRVQAFWHEVEIIDRGWPRLPGYFYPDTAVAA